MLDTKGSYFSAFAQYGVATHDDMLVHKHLVFPFLHTGVNLKRFTIGRGAKELGVDFQKRCANDAACFDQFAPRQYTALHEKIQ